MNQPAPQKASGLSITSLALGILGLCCPIFLPALGAVICGHLARGQIKRSGGTLGGGGMAMAGLILGYLSLAIALLLTIFYSVMIGKMVPAAMDFANAEKIHAATVRMVEDGSTKEDKLLGWPADTGVTTVTEFRQRLVDNGYLSKSDAETIDFSRLIIGNVSASDSGNTIFIKVRAEIFPGMTMYLQKDGMQNILTANGDIPFQEPPRTPAYLEP